MSVNCNFFEAGFDLVPDIINGDANSDLTGDWINLANYDRAYLVLIKPSGSAGDDLSIDINQATTVSGGSVKALEFSKLWYKKGTMSSEGTWTAVELTTPSSDLDLVDVNGVDLATDTVAAVVVVEILASSLDVNGGFKFVQVLYEGDDIGNALVINSHWILSGSAYPRNIPASPLA